MPGRMTTEGLGGPGRKFWSFGVFDNAFRIRLRMIDTVTTALAHIKSANGQDIVW